jgi:uncharacterized protein YutE (UPF0331/DUF86 family)
MEQLEKPRDAYGAIEMLGKVGVLPRELAERLAPIAGFRNILVHEYLEINWNKVLRNLGCLRICTALWSISRNG